jgi:hypothetical protein
MKIDRSRFMVLTAALSAAACVVHEHYSPPPPPPPPPPPAQTAAAKPPLKIVLHEGVRPAAPAPAPAPGPHPVIVLHGAAPVTPGPTPAPTPGPTPAPTAPPAPTPAPTAACFDSGTATLPPCTANCASNPFIAQRCATYGTNFDPKVAAAAITCMNGNTGAAACDSGQAYTCGKTALSQACPDPTTVTQLCQIAATPCKVAQNDCVTMISGLNPSGQDAVAQCVAKGCSAGLYSCIEGLSPAASAAATRH